MTVGVLELRIMRMYGDVRKAARGAVQGREEDERAAFSLLESMEAFPVTLESLLRTNVAAKLKLLARDKDSCMTAISLRIAELRRAWKEIIRRLPTARVEVAAATQLDLEKRGQRHGQGATQHAKRTLRTYVSSCVQEVLDHVSATPHVQNLLKMPLEENKGSKRPRTSSTTSPAGSPPAGAARRDDALAGCACNSRRHGFHSPGDGEGHNPRQGPQKV